MKNKKSEETEYDESVLNDDFPLEPEVAAELRIFFQNEKKKRHSTTDYKDAMSYRLPGSFGTGKRR